MSTLRLTQYEKELILEKRQEAAALKATREFQYKAIRIANRFMQWSKKNGSGLTYSTFCNEFCYEDEDRQHMYKAIQKIIDTASSVYKGML